MKTQMKNVLLVIGMLIVLVSACGPLGSESTPVVASEPIVEVTEEPAVIPTESVAEEPALPPINSYIGMVYPPFPEGLTKGFSMIIQGSDDNGLSFVLGEAGRMLWLEKVNRYDENGSPFWEVADVLDLSNIENGAVLIPDGCSLNGRIDNEIFVVAKNETVLLAWRANTALDKFEVLAVNGITCNSDKGMLFE